ncbi:MAG: helix-turn-helix domain-containing protein [Prevotellaceae bacterium]|nr:helix-turn-helix domain-containing protein [Prevotellaceae bacterium]
MCRNNFVILITLLVCVLSASAKDDIDRKSYAELERHAHHIVKTIQDDRGFWWCATSNGLYRYDGYDFVNFVSQPGDGCDMNTTEIKHLYAGSDDNLWCLVGARALVFDIRKCKYFDVLKPFEKAKKTAFAVEKIRPMQNGTTLLGTSDGKVFAVKKERNDYVAHLILSNIEKIDDVFQTMNGTLNISTPKGKFAYLNGKVKRLPDSTDMRANLYHSPMVKEKPKTDSVRYVNLSDSTEIKSFLFDKKNRIWAGNHFEPYVKILRADASLIGYLGTDGRIHRERTPFFGRIYCMMQDRHGTIWMGSKPDGLFRLTEKNDGSYSVERYTHDDSNRLSINDNSVVDMHEDARGRLWLSTFGGGMNCIENPQSKNLTFLNCDNYFSKQGKVSTKNFTITRSGMLLVSYRTGLLVADIDRKDLRNLQFHFHQRDANRASSLSDNTIHSIHEDSKGRIFIAHEGTGLDLITSKDLNANELEFQHINTSTGFPTNNCLSIAEYKGILYVVAYNQIIEYSPDSDENINSFFLDSGYRFAETIPLIYGNGKSLLGLENGMLYVPFEEMKSTSNFAKMSISSVYIQDEPADYTYTYRDTIIMHPKHRSLRLSFMAYDASNEGMNGIRYAYRLNRGKWEQLGKSHEISFVGLAPGTYTLEIRSTNGNGIWQDNTKTITIIVKPTFIETIWAKILLLLIIVGVTIAIYKSVTYVRRLKKKQEETLQAYLQLLSKNEEEKQNEWTRLQQLANDKAEAEDNAFMKRVMEFIDRNLGNDDVEIGDMAEFAMVSRSVLNKKVKRLFGLTPIEIMKEARINVACNLLKTTDLNISEVAYKCGFSDPKYFSKCFKQTIGVTPKEYRGGV